MTTHRDEGADGDGAVRAFFLVGGGLAFAGIILCVVFWVPAGMAGFGDALVWCYVAHYYQRKASMWRAIVYRRVEVAAHAHAAED